MLWDEMIELIFEHARRHSPNNATCVLEARLIDVWYQPELHGVGVALEAAATHFKSKALLPQQDDYQKRMKAGKRFLTDLALERVIFSFVAVFVCKLDDPLIVGFRTLVPEVFDVYLARGSRGRPASRAR